jgi:hypothetical protein
MSQPHPAPIVVGPITAQVMPSRGCAAGDRWYWRARRNGAGQEYAWTGRGTPDEVLRILAGMVAGGAAAPSPKKAAPAPAAPAIETVAQAMDAWWSTVICDSPDIAVRSREVYRCRGRAIAGTIGHVALAQLDARHVEAHRSARHRAGKAARTIRHEVISLLAAWRWWRDLGWVTAIPPPIPAMRAREVEIRTPTEAEVQLVLAAPPSAVRVARDALYRHLGRIAKARELAALEHRDLELSPAPTQAGVVHLARGKATARSMPLRGPLVDLLRAVHRPGSADLLLGYYAPDLVREVLVVQAATGARIGEVAALEHSDIELDEGGRSGWLHLGRHERAEKTGPRSVPISGALVDLLVAWWRPGAVGPLWGFKTMTVLGKISRWWTGIPWERLRVERWSPHGHRRMAVDRLLRAGVEVAAAAVLLGHDPKTMWAHYRRVTAADLQRAARLGGLGELGQSNVVSLEARRKA